MYKLLKYLLCVLCACLITSACFSQGTNPIQFQEFASNEGRFKVNLPTAPKESVKEIDSPAGKIKSHRFAADSGGMSYDVSYADYTPLASVMTANQQRRIFDLTRDSMCNQPPPMTLLDEQEIEYDGRLGRELTLTISGVIVHYRLIFDGNRFYQLVAGYDASLQKNAATQVKLKQFMDSFQVIEQR